MAGRYWSANTWSPGRGVYRVDAPLTDTYAVSPPKFRPVEEVLVPRNP